MMKVITYSNDGKDAQYYGESEFDCSSACKNTINNRTNKSCAMRSMLLKHTRVTARKWTVGIICVSCHPRSQTMHTPNWHYIHITPCRDTHLYHFNLHSGADSYMGSSKLKRLVDSVKYISSPFLHSKTAVTRLTANRKSVENLIYRLYVLFGLPTLIPQSTNAALWTIIVGYYIWCFFTKGEERGKLLMSTYLCMYPRPQQRSTGQQETKIKTIQGYPIISTVQVFV